MIITLMQCHCGIGKHIFDHHETDCALQNKTVMWILRTKEFNLFILVYALQVLRRGYWSYECKCHQRKCNIQREKGLLSSWIHLLGRQVACGNNHRTLSSSQIFYIMHLCCQIRTTKCYIIINYISNECGIVIVIGSLHQMKPQAFNCIVFSQV